MKIIFIDPEPPSKHGGGIRTYLRLCLELCKISKIETQVYSFNQNSYPGSISFPIGRQTIPSPWIRKFLYLFAYSTAVRLEYSQWLCSKFLKMANGSTWFEFADFMGLAWYSAKNSQLKKHIHLRIHTPEYLINSKSNNLAGFFNKYIEKKSMQSAAILSTPSAAFVSQNLPEFKRALYLKNPIAQKIDSQSNPGEMNLLFIGRIEQRKGLHILINALEEIKEFKLTVVGAWGDDDYSLKLKNKVLNLSAASSKFIIAGEVPKSEIRELATHHNFCVIPSLWENSSYSFFEALNLNLFCIGSGTGEMGEAFSEMGEIPPPPGNVSLLAQKLKEINKNCSANPSFYFDRIKKQDEWYRKRKQEADTNWINYYQKKSAANQ